MFQAYKWVYLPSLNASYLAHSHMGSKFGGLSPQ